VKRSCSSTVEPVAREPGAAPSLWKTDIRRTWRWMGNNQWDEWATLGYAGLRWATLGYAGLRWATLGYIRRTWQTESGAKLGYAEDPGRK